MRVQALAGRRGMTPADTRSADAALLAGVVDLARRHTRVAGYIPMDAEPGGPGLVEALAGAVTTLLLPVVQPDRDLDWAPYEGGSRLGAALAGGGRLREPMGDRLGPDAIATVDLVLVPALAVDRRGMRLGRGGGSYDRALVRVRAGTPIVALLYDGELRHTLPAEPHDRPVSAILTPSGLLTVPVPMV